MSKQKILFLASRPRGLEPLALDSEARAIRIRLERSTYRDQFELVNCGAVQPLDLLHELQRLKPTIVHFSGHGTDDDESAGLSFCGADGTSAVVSTRALANTFQAAGASVKAVVLSACYSKVQAAAIVEHVDVAIGTAGSIRDDAAVNFSVGFYGGLGEGEPVEAAFRHGCAAIDLQGLPECDIPQMEIHHGANAGKLSLVTDRGSTTSVQYSRPAANAGIQQPADGAIATQRLLKLCASTGLRLNRQAQWTQVGPNDAVGHGSRDPRIFYINHSRPVADLRSYAGPADLMTRAIESGGDIANGQIVARIPLNLFSEDEWHRFARHNV